MPAPLPVPGVVRLQMVHSIAGEQASYSLYFSKLAASPWALSDVILLASEASAAWTAHLKGYQTTDVTFAYAKATDLSSSSAPEYLVIVNSPGSSAPPTVPNNVALHIEFLIATRYRGGHPGVFFPGLQQVDLADSRTWDPTVAEGITFQFVEFLDAIISTPAYSFGTPPDHVAISRSSGHVIRPSPEVELIIGYTAQQRIASRRKRLGKGIYPELP